VVARVAGRPILASEIARDARVSGSDPAAALEARVRFELLATAAAAAGLPPSPTDEESLRQAKVERLIEDRLEPRLRRDAIPEAEVRTFYDRVRKRFVHGRLVQVAVLCVFSGARMKAEPRARAARRAAELRDYLDAHPGLDDDAFLAIGHDPAWTEHTPSVSSTTVWQDDAEPFPAVVGEAVARLGRRGQTTPLVGDETGYYVARYLAERPPERVSFAEARPRLEEEMWLPWRRRRFLDLTLELARGHEVEAFPESFPALVPPDDPDRPPPSAPRPD
jgi:hypothetical protein